MKTKSDFDVHILFSVFTSSSSVGTIATTAGLSQWFAAFSEARRLRRRKNDPAIDDKEMQVIIIIITRFIPSLPLSHLFYCHFILITRQDSSRLWMNWKLVVCYATIHHVEQLPNYLNVKKTTICNVDTPFSIVILIHACSLNFTGFLLNFKNKQ